MDNLKKSKLLDGILLFAIAFGVALIMFPYSSSLIAGLALGTAVYINGRDICPPQPLFKRYDCSICGHAAKRRDKDRYSLCDSCYSHYRGRVEQELKKRQSKRGLKMNMFVS